MKKMKTCEICDELEEVIAIVAFMEDATVALLEIDTGTLPGKKMQHGIKCIYAHVNAKLENISGQVEALKH